jgi:hypothetical protein
MGHVGQHEPDSIIIQNTKKINTLKRTTKSFALGKV